jgi:hypothetical protein
MFPEGSGTWLILLDYDLLLNKRQVIKSRDAPAVGQIKRRYGGFGSITLVGEARPNTLVHSVERLWAIHKGEGRNIGQINLDQFCVSCLDLFWIGHSGDRFDQFIGEIGRAHV